MRSTDEFIRELNLLLAEDIMHGIQWRDLDDQERGWFLKMWDRGIAPKDALDILASANNALKTI